MRNNKSLLADSLIEICSKKPLDHVTVTEITKTAGLTRQVFYHHFVDKYELAKWIHMMDYVEQLELKQKEGTDEVSWMEVCFEWLSILDKHRKFYRNVYYSTVGKEFQRIIRNQFYDSYKLTVEYVMGSKLSKGMEFSLELYCIGLTEKIHDWICDGAEVSINQFCQWIFMAMPKELQRILLAYKVPRRLLIDATKNIAQRCEVDRRNYTSYEA